MKRLSYKFFTAVALLVITGVLALTAWAEFDNKINPAYQAVLQGEAIKEMLEPQAEFVDTEKTPKPQGTEPEKTKESPEPQEPEKAEEPLEPAKTEEPTPGDAVQAGSEEEALTGPQSDENKNEENTDTQQQEEAGTQKPENTIYVDNSNFKAAMQEGPEKIIITEPIIWEEPFDESGLENIELTTETPVEIELGAYSIIVKENSRLTLTGPFHITGEESLFQIEGMLFLDGVSLDANGQGAAAVTFSDSVLSRTTFTKELELNNCSLSVGGTDGIGIDAAAGVSIRMKNTEVLCAGENSTGVFGVSDSGISIYDQSRFEVQGKNAAGLVIPEAVSGFLEFETIVCGDGSRGILVLDGGRCVNSGTVTVSGERAVGVYLQEGAYRVEAGAVAVTGGESTGIFSEGKLEVSQLSLKAGRGVAAEAAGPLTLILCDIDALPGGLLSHSGELVLDTCRVSNTPDEAKIKTRKAQPYLNGHELPDGGYLFEPYDLGAFGFSIPAGTKRLQLPDELTFSLYDPEDPAVRTIEQLLPVQWEQVDYDLDEIGDYKIHYRGDGGTLPLEIAGAVTVHVYDSSQPRLICAVRMGDNHTELYFVPDIQDAEQIRLWVSSDKGATWRDYIAEEEAQPWAHLGFITTGALKENTEYLLKLEIIGGTYPGTSPVLSYWRNEREIKWENGDRDGGDQRPQEQTPRPEPPPAVTSKPSRPPSSGSHSRPGGGIVILPSKMPPPEEPDVQPVFGQNPPEEKPSGNGIELTQQELEDLIDANPEKITVISDKIKAELPVKVLETIMLEPEENVSVVLERPAENAFAVRVYAGVREVTSLERPVKVTIPDAKGAKQAVSQASGAFIAAEEKEEGEAAFSIPEPGTYILNTPSAEPEPARQDAKNSQWFWLLGAALFIALLPALYMVLGKRRAIK